MKKLTVVLLGLCFLGAMSHFVLAANWTTFRANYERTGFVQEQAEGALTFKWKYNTAQPIISSPIVVNSVVYVGSRNGVLYALNADTGGLVWQYASQTGGWMDASPTYSDGILYMACRDGNIYAFDAVTGNLKWKKTIGGVICSSPVVSSSGILYTGLGYPNREVSAFNTWGTKAQKWIYSTGQMVYSSPALNGNNIYIGSDDGKFYSFNLDSSAPRWQFSTIGGIYMFTPAVSGGKVYVAPGDADRKIYCLNETSGSPEWTYSVPGTGYTSVSSVAISETACYIVSGNPEFQLCALDIVNNGSEIWRKSIGS
ncbi:MAG: hypothetical protein C0408_11430, partial [Odoribacter sp.]|nr:hypothetical protein [Odoribacter sp.]